MKRTLSLKREALAELAADDLGAVAGAAPDASGGGGITCPVLGCVSQLVTCRTCISGPLGC